MASPLPGRFAIPSPGSSISEHDPFNTTPSRSQSHRYSSFDTNLFSTYTRGSPSQAKRALEAHIVDTDRRIQEASKLGTALLEQKKQLAERLRDVDSQHDDGEVGPELKQKLLDLEREYNEVGRETARAFLTKSRKVSNDDANSGAMPSSNSPSKPQVNSRKVRNTPGSRVHDIEFATEISTSLLDQVRQMQSLLTEKEEALKAANRENEKTQANVEIMANRLRAIDNDEQRYKDENWHLETRIQELSIEVKEAAAREQKLNSVLETHASERDAADKEFEELRLAHVELDEERGLVKKQHETELSGLRRNMLQGETERAGLEKKIQELQSQNEDFARAMAYRSRLDSEVRGMDNDLEAEGAALNFDMPDPGLPPSPTKGTPRHGTLESETLRSSLNHAHRMIQNLKNNIHREKTEKVELKRMLQDARDELESRRADGGVAANASKKRRPNTAQDAFKKPARPDRLGASKNAQEEIMNDPSWEEYEDSPLRSRAFAKGDTYDTGTETSDAFETANENNTATESEAFHTGAESMDDSDDLTETESSNLKRSTHTPLASKRPSNRRSLQSTASDEGDPYDLTTPPSNNSQARNKSLSARLGLNRSSASPNVQGSPASYVSNGSQPAAYQDLAAELEDMDDLNSTPARSTGSQEFSPASRQASASSLRYGSPALQAAQSASSLRFDSRSPAFQSAQGASSLRLGPPNFASQTATAKPAMVDSGMVTEPWEPSPRVVYVEATQSSHAAAKSSLANSAKGLSQGAASDRSNEPDFRAEMPGAFHDESEEAEISTGSAFGQPSPSTSVKSLGFSTIKSQHYAPREVIPATSEPRMYGSPSQGMPYRGGPEFMRSPQSPRALQLSMSTISSLHTKPIEPVRPEPRDNVYARNEALPLREAQNGPGHLDAAVTKSSTLASIFGPVSSLETNSTPNRQAGSAMIQNNQDLTRTAAHSTSTAFPAVPTNSQTLMDRAASQQVTPSGGSPTLARSTLAFANSLLGFRTNDGQDKAASTATDSRSESVKSSASTIKSSVHETSEVGVNSASVRPKEVDINARQPQQTPTQSNVHKPVNFDWARPQEDQGRQQSAPAPLTSSQAAQRHGQDVQSVEDEETAVLEPPLHISRADSRPGNFQEPTLQFGDASLEPDRRAPFKSVSGNVDQRALKMPSKNDVVPVGMTARNRTLDEGTQTMVSAEQIEFLLRERNSRAMLVTTIMPLTSSPRPQSLGRESSMTNASLVNLPSSSRSRSGSGSRAAALLSLTGPSAPPLPVDHKEVIAAAASRNTFFSGSMGPPPVPTSAYKLAPPQTHNRTTSVASMAQQSPSKSSRSRPTSVGANRAESTNHQDGRRSVASFASDVEDRGKTNFSEGFEMPSADPRMIQAITQTMIGEYLWKYTRKAGRGEHSEKRHKRFFWIHPYTHTLYWSADDPATAGRTDLKSKSVAIEAVRVVSDDNVLPPGLHGKSIIVVTPGRSIKFTAPTNQRHETWFNALSYLLLRSGPDRAGAQSRASTHRNRDPSHGRTSTMTSINSDDLNEFSVGMNDRSASRMTDRSGRSVSRNGRASAASVHNSEFLKPIMPASRMGQPSPQKGGSSVNSNATGKQRATDSSTFNSSTSSDYQAAQASQGGYASTDGALDPANSWPANMYGSAPHYQQSLETQQQTPTYRPQPSAPLTNRATNAPSKADTQAGPPPTPNTSRRLSISNLSDFFSRRGRSRSRHRYSTTIASAADVEPPMPTRGVQDQDHTPSRADVAQLVNMPSLQAIRSLESRDRQTPNQYDRNRASSRGATRQNQNLAPPVLTLPTSVTAPTGIGLSADSSGRHTPVQMENVRACCDG